MSYRGELCVLIEHCNFVLGEIIKQPESQSHERRRVNRIPCADNCMCFSGQGSSWGNDGCPGCSRPDSDPRAIEAGVLELRGEVMWAALSRPAANRRLACGGDELDDWPPPSEDP